MKQLMLIEILIIYGGSGECTCKSEAEHYLKTIKYSVDTAITCYNTCCDDRKGVTWLFVSTITAANFSDRAVLCKIY